MLEDISTYVYMGINSKKNPMIELIRVAATIQYFYIPVYRSKYLLALLAAL